MPASRHPLLRFAQLLGVAAAAWLAISSASAQVVWDNGGGTNSWGTANNWNPNALPTAASVVQFNATDDNATVSNISLDANRSASRLVFNNVDDNFSLTNGSGSRTLTLANGNITRTAGSSGTQQLTFSTLALGANATFDLNGSGGLTISSIIANSGGARSITRTGSGVLTLSGNNTFSGGLTLSSSGTLNLGHNNALGSGTFTVNGGTVAASGGARSIANAVNVGGNFSIGGSQNLTFTGTINLGGATRTITVNNTATTTFAGSVTEPWYSGLTKAGAGELVLSGSNNFSAPVTVSAGTLTLAHSNALGASGTYGNTVANGATLAFTGNITVNESHVAVTGSGVGHTGALRNLSGNNTFTGTVALGGATRIVADSGRLTLSGDTSLNSGALTVAGAGDVTLSGAVYGNNSLTHSGSGTLTLSGSSANSFGGALNVQSGTVALAKSSGTNALAGSAINVGDGSGAAASAVLRLDASHQIADHAGTLTIASDGVLRLNGHSDSIKSLAGTGLIELSTGLLTVGANSGSSSFGGSISGSGTLAKIGSGTLTFTSDIAFNGTLELSGGTLALTGTSLSATHLLVTGNTTIDFGGGLTDLHFTNFTIAAGVTLTILNWTDAVDKFFADHWTGATYDTSGSNPMTQVVFAGWGANDTHWRSWDNQITPVPEPSTYGAILLGSLVALFVFFRRRRA